MSKKRQRLMQLPWRSRATIAREVDDELAFHLESRVGELVASGLDADAARRQALAEFGDIEFTRKYCRTVDERSDRAVRFADRFAEWRQDAWYALRTLRRAPGFTVVSLLTLALAIGANTAIFSVARAVLLAPLPYANANDVYRLFESETNDQANYFPFAPANYFDYRDQSRAFSGFAGYMRFSPTWLPEHGDPQLLSAATVTANMFDVLGVRPIYGRGFVAGDDRTGNDSKVVLAYEFWRRNLGANPAAVGQRITLSGKAYDVVGVMPRGFTLGLDEELWLPLTLDDAMADPVRARRQHYLNVLARSKPGVTLRDARADLASVGRRLEKEYPESNTNRAPLIMPIREAMTGRLRSSLLLLQGAALLVLLIACANLTNLTLSRAIGRRREMALRAALGAGRARLARQLLTESIMLAIFGGALGIVIAVISTRAVLALNSEALPAMFDARVDGQVLLFSVALSIGTGVLFGLVPAVHTARADLNASLKEGGRSASGGGGGESVRRGLVIAQIALAVVLLVGTGLLVRSFRELLHTQLGFDPEHVLTAQVRAAGTRYDSSVTMNAFFDDALREIASAPGVVAAGAAASLPTRGAVGSTIRVDGEPVDEKNVPEIEYVAIRGDYFKAMRMSLLAGRSYDASDRQDGAKTIIINQAALRRFFPNGNALGRSIHIGPDPNGAPITIIGVVNDIRADGVDIPAKPTLFANHRQESWERTMSFVVRTTGDPMRIAPAIRHAVRAADPTLALRDVKPLTDVIGAGLASRRFALALVSAFAAIALLLAAIGIYGVLSYAVANRTREFGVRLALGATTHNVLMLVVRQGLTWSVLGLVLGIVGAVAGARLLTGMLYGVTALDPSTYLVVGIGLLAVACAACLVPAARATRVDPLTSMRSD